MSYYANAFDDYSKMDSINVQYDIQGQIVSLDDISKPYVQGPLVGNLDYYTGSYSDLTTDEKAAGSGDTLIPSTSPGLQPQVAPPAVGSRDSGPIVDPLKQAVDANAAALKDMGQINVSQADFNSVNALDTLAASYGTI